MKKIKSFLKDCYYFIEDKYATINWIFALIVITIGTTLLQIFPPSAHGLDKIALQYYIPIQFLFSILTTATWVKFGRQTEIVEIIFIFIVITNIMMFVAITLMWSFIEGLKYVYGG